MSVLRLRMINPDKFESAPSAYLKLAKAFLGKRGTNLTGEEVDMLMNNDAISTAIINMTCDDEFCEGATP